MDYLLEDVRRDNFTSFLLQMMFATGSSFHVPVLFETYWFSKKSRFLLLS